jgi:hypothetical protein
MIALHIWGRLGTSYSKRTCMEFCKQCIVETNHNTIFVRLCKYEPFRIMQSSIT